MESTGSDLQDFIPGYNIRYIELETVCAWLTDNGWAGGIGFDEAVKAMTQPAELDVKRLARALDLAAEGLMKRDVISPNSKVLAAVVVKEYYRLLQGEGND